MHKLAYTEFSQDGGRLFENNEVKRYFLNRLRSKKSTPEKFYFVHVDLSKI